jgi:hypothetical protein
MKDFKKLDMQQHVRVKLQTNTHLDKPLVIGDPPNLLNAQCANWTDVVVVDGKAYDKEAVARLLMQLSLAKTKNEILIDALDGAAKTVGFLSYHLRGRVAEEALLDMAAKADEWASVVKSASAQE